MKPVYFIVFALSIIFNSSANIILRHGMRNIDFSEFSVKTIWENIITNFWVWLGVISYGLALVAFSYVLSNKEQGELSFAYPINVGLCIVIIALVSFLVYGDSFSWQRIVGSVLIIGGVLLIGSTAQSAG